MMLNANQLRASSVVANATMNRGRGLSGVNSYQRELRFDIFQFLAERVQLQGQAVWYDACCGQGRALIEAGREFATTDWGHALQIIGVDLIDMFLPCDLPPAAPSVRLIAADVADFFPDVPADLITCVHGLHYLGDKLGFLQNTHAHLAPGGVFLGHLDAKNVREVGQKSSIWSQAVRQARKRGALLKLTQHRLFLEQSPGAWEFGMTYHGATVSPEPNYTGITVIDSWYTPHLRSLRPIPADALAASGRDFG